MDFDTGCDLAVEAKTPEERASIAVMRKMEECGSLLTAIQAFRRPTGRSLRPLQHKVISDAGVLLARSHLADPERPKDPEGRLAHIAKRLVLRVQSSVWIGLSAAGLVAFAAARRWSRTAKAPSQP